MSMRTLFIWIMLAGFLGAGVLAVRAQQLNNRQSTPIATTRTLEFDPATTAALEIKAQGRRQILTQAPNQPDQWILHWTHDGRDYHWPTQSIKARSGLRALATARINTSNENLVTDPTGELIIRQQDGSSMNIEFDSASSGGYTAIRVEERGTDGVATSRWFGRIEKTISDAFISTGMLYWRSDRVFPVANSAIRSIDIAAGAGEVKLRRSTQGWALTHPYPMHGNQSTIDELVKSLLAIKSSTFVDESIDPATTWMNAPIATINLATTNETVSLIIGAQADVNGDTVYATIKTPTQSALVTMKADQLAGLTAAPAAYISKSPSPLNASAIGSIHIEGRDSIARLITSRSGASWNIGENPADSLNRDSINRLIAVLTKAQAQHVQSYGTEGLPKELGYIKLFDASGNQLDRLAVALQSSPGGMQLVLMKTINDDQVMVWGIRSEDATATGAWLTAVASKRVP